MIMRCREHTRHRPATGFALAAALLAVCIAPASAADSVTVEQPWMRFIIKARPAAGYMTLRNTGDKPAVLIEASSPACGMLMLHRSSRENGVEKMRDVDSVTVPPHGTATFSPGSYHLMCMQPQMQPGANVPVTLKFQNGATITAQFPIKGPAGK